MKKNKIIIKRGVTSSQISGSTEEIIVSKTGVISIRRVVSKTRKKK